MSVELDPTDGMPTRKELAISLLCLQMKNLSRTLLSEDWADDLEFDVWEMAFEGAKLFGQIDVTEDTRKSFQDLATLAKGWWIKGDDGNPLFIAIDTWKKSLAEEES